MNEQISNLIQEAVDKKYIPGANLRISFEGKEIYKRNFGNRKVSLDEKKPMQLDTSFDLASLTKVVATLPAVLKLVDEGKLSLDDKVASFFSENLMEGKKDIQLMHLLTHTSGLPAYQNFQKENLNNKEIIAKIIESKMVGTPGEQVLYSDLGYILLYKIIEKASDQKFNVFVQEKIFEPLEMKNTVFNPQTMNQNFAATQYNSQTKTMKCGVVHDGNAEIMGGISGHAGLFSTISDLGRFATMIENDGVYKGNRILSSSIVKKTRKNYTPFSKSFRGLGWMLQNSQAISCGDYFSELSYGHTGFTGTSLWFDPEINLNVIFLTNSVLFDKKDLFLTFRPKLHNVIRSHFLKG